MRRFFCENCGEEVREQNDVCPHCGAFFSAIKCPQCGYRGKLHEFRKGCPKCGYLSEEELIFGNAPAEGRSAKAREPWPAWLFWLVIGAMLASFFVLSRIYVRLT